VVVVSKFQRESGNGTAITSADLGGSSSYSNEVLLSVVEGFKCSFSCRIIWGRCCSTASILDDNALKAVVGEGFLVSGDRPRVSRS